MGGGRSGFRLQRDTRLNEPTEPHSLLVQWRRCRHDNTMKRTTPLLLAGLAAIALGSVGVPAAAERGVIAQDKTARDQGQARREMRAGNQLSLREIERRVLPSMRGSEYLGNRYDETARAYRLKFIKNGRVTYVDVDARTGRIINRSR